jgi:hypothetical protein
MPNASNTLLSLLFCSHIGLDPAGPGFHDAPLEMRIDPADAKFVDVIHTNSGDLLTTFGTTHISGHCDFWPNGGKHQPGIYVKTFRYMKLRIM